MAVANRGWTNFENAATALEVDIRFGNDLVAKESSDWPEYVVVTTPTAYSTAKPYLKRDPVETAFVNLLDWSELSSIAQKLDVGANLVVGLGGGRALDASKYIALATELPLVLVPTVVSTGAIIHSMFAKWNGRKISSPKEWPWVDCEHVLVDYDLA